MYRIMTINGKKYYSLSIPKIISKQGEIEPDNYNLDTIPLYVEESDNIFDNIYESEMIFDSTILDISKNSIFFCAMNIENDTHFAVFKQPLMLFFYPELLEDHELLMQILQNYPNMIYSFLKEKFNKYISVKEKANFIIDRKLYPYKNISKKLINELFKDKKYMIDFISVLIQQHSFFEFCLINPDCEKSLRLFMQIHITDKDFITNVFLKINGKIQNTYITKVMNWLDMDKYDMNYYYKFEKENICWFDKIIKKIKKIDNKIKKIYKYCFETKDYDRLCKLIIEKVELEERIFLNQNKNDAIVKNIQDINDLDILVSFAKNGYSLSKYSDQYEDDIDLIYLELRNRDYSLQDIPSHIFSDKDAILKLRNVCQDILLRVDEELYSNIEFMLEYLRLYSCQSHFYISSKLINNKDFMMNAKMIDPYISYYEKVM